MRERIALGVKTRLDILAPHREAVRRMLAFLALPANLPLAARLLYRTIDAIWYAAGDRATDFSFYTKRGLLAGVYASTTPLLARRQVEGRRRDLALPRPPASAR